MFNCDGRKGCRPILPINVTVTVMESLGVDGPLWCIHTDWNRDRDKDREQMGGMKQCGSFHITPEPGQG